MRVGKPDAFGSQPVQVGGGNFGCFTVAGQVAVAQVRPSALPTSVRLEWWRDGELLRISREVGITAPAAGFRVWDAYRPQSGAVPPGHYRVVLRTVGRRVFGVAKITVGD